ncbi:MAG: phosphoribosylglycinamide formyltransferase [Actinomycetota bacterium]|nr:phosphoribosylglycinamide formyltransferase [Actinomycetota bacterium]
MRVGVLASGAGTNLQVLLDAPDVDVAAVASDKPGARALERAEAAGVPTRVFPRGDFPDRVARDAAIAAWLHERGVGLVVLAGYMQLVSPEFLAAFPQRVINVHPSLLPAYPGLDAIGQAIEYGAKVTGVSVFFVDEGVDTGAVILQRAVEVGDARDAAALHARLQPVEHELLPEAVRLIAAGRVSFDPANPRRVVVD